MNLSRKALESLGQGQNIQDKVQVTQLKNAVTGYTEDQETQLECLEHTSKYFPETQFIYK